MISRSKFNGLEGWLYSNFYAPFKIVRKCIFVFKFRVKVCTWLHIFAQKSQSEVKKFVE